MNARNSISKVSPTAGVTRGAILLAVQIILFVAVFCLVGQPALAKHKGHTKGPKNCTKMSNYAFTARLGEITDDYFIAVGKCYNLPPDEDIKQCIKDAVAEKKDALDEAKDQRDARLDLCDQVGEDPYNPELNPTDFVDPATITSSNANPYWPLVPGYMWTYKTYDKYDNVIETNTVEVLDPTVESVTIEGIPCAVVHDVVYAGDTTNPAALKEDTYDWYGQKSNGEVWYLGEFSLEKQVCDEETGELCDGLFADDGSWQAGFDGGEGGILMFADPSAKKGTVYRQELYLGEAEDAAEVIGVGDQIDPPIEVTVPYKQGAGNTFDTNVLKTYEFSVLEPGVAEYKYYAPGVGVLVEQALEDDMPTGEENRLWDTNVPMP
jgi:hypothetical protein